LRKLGGDVDAVVAALRESDLAAGQRRQARKQLKLTRADRYPASSFQKGCLCACGHSHCIDRPTGGTENARRRSQRDPHVNTKPRAPPRGLSPCRVWTPSLRERERECCSCSGPCR
jgi:hypothetical protein